MEKTLCYNNKYSRTGTFLTVLFCFYLFFCYFEPYINFVLGPVGKYLVFVIIICFFFSYKRIKFEWYHFSILLWFFLKAISIIWASFNFIVRQQIYSQIGMVALFTTMTIVAFDEHFCKASVNTLLSASTCLGVLSIFFSSAYNFNAVFEGMYLHLTYTERQVLTLFGVQNDPNYQAAFLLTGVAISFYNLFDLRKNTKRFNFMMLAIILINSYAVFKTGSRGGLVSIVLIAAVAALLSQKGKRVITLNLIRNVALIIVGFFLLYALAKNFLPAETFNRMFAISSYNSGDSRLDNWQKDIQIFIDSPLIGGGWGSYWGYDGNFFAVHNTFIAVLIDVGIIGFLLLFLPVVVLLFKSFRQRYILPLLLLVSGMAPALFLDSINMRFFWNSIIIAFMLYKNKSKVSDHIDQKTDQAIYK